MNRSIVPRILVIDDDPHVCDVMEAYLSDEGFAVSSARTAQQGIKAALSDPPDLLLLDLRLPDMSGLEACRKIRASTKTAIIMLTSLGDPVDRVVGLESGADDYIVKPFIAREVIARVRAVLRRTRKIQAIGDQEETTSHRLATVGDLEIDREAHEVHLRGKKIAVTRTEFMLLVLLAQHPGRVVTREQVVRVLEAGGTAAVDRTLDNHISNLRRKIEPDQSNPRFVVTVYGVGFKMEKPSSNAK
jgi:DNA-binding response OmpR family regulator